MKNFTGNLEWIHLREGHYGRPYWPGGMSGVTLDPGVDLGHVLPEVLSLAYGNIMTRKQLNEALSLKGVTGNRAEQALFSLDALNDFRISRDQAAEIFPVVVEPYWSGLIKRWPNIENAPPPVQTALLSLSFNRGFNNSKLEILTESIFRSDWRRVGEMIEDMQQDHMLEGIRLRRRQEGELILNNL